MDYLRFDIGSCPGGALFEIELRGSAARVCLMDADNYQAYLDDEEYEFTGGVFDVSPVVLEVPYDGYWFVVIDSYPGQIKARVQEVFD